MSKKIRKGDRILVIAGNEKGKTGEVIQRQDDRVVIQGLNMRKKHLRPTQQMQGGRIIEMEKPIHISNVCLCDKEGSRMKAKVKQEQSGERTLVAKSGKVHRSMKKPA
jgi:large subunit ribosomal protein L24